MLAELHRRLAATLEGLQGSFEIVFVNDACPEGSLDVLRKLEAGDPRVRVIPLEARRGQHAALLIGLAASRGQIVVTMDADLQDRPEAIPELIATLARGYGAVYAGRRGRYESRRRLAMSWVFKHAISLITGMPADAGAFIAMRRDVADRIVGFADRPLYLTAAIAWAGRPVLSIPVVRDARLLGASSYSGGMRLRMAARALAQAVRWRIGGVAR